MMLMPFAISPEYFHAFFFISTPDIFIRHMLPMMMFSFDYACFTGCFSFSMMPPSFATMPLY